MLPRLLLRMTHLPPLFQHPPTMLPVRIGLRESNLHRGDAILMDVSDPKSDKYGKHLSADEVMKTQA